MHVTGGTGSIGTTTTGSGNSIIGNSYGVLVYSASCSFGPVKIRRNYIGANSSTGVFVDDTNQADLGTSGEYGNNRIESNGSASIWNSSSCGAISARGNFFNDCEYGTEVVGSVDTANRLCTAPFDPFGQGDVAVEPVPQEAPISFRGVSPNPSSGHTTIRVAVASPAGLVRIEIFDVSGRRLKVLADRSFQAGSHEFSWDGRRDDGSEAPSGLYFVRGSINDARRESARILIVR